MQPSRPLMDVNEDSEILFKLGILTSKAKSKSRHGKAEFTGPGPSLASGSSITDDEDSDLDILYDKRSLLISESHPENDVKCTKLSPRRVLPALSFIALGLLSSILFVTLPDIRAATNTINTISVFHVLLFNGFGYFFGNFLLSRFFNRCNPLLLLMLCTACSIPFTLIIAWCTALQFIYLYSSILGAFLGSLHQGSLMIIGGNGFGIRTLLLLHACLACGAMFAPIAGALFIDGSTSHNFIIVTPTEQGSILAAEAHKIVRRALSDGVDIVPTQGTLSTNASFLNITISSEPVTGKPKRPEQAVGIQVSPDKKTQENQQKRNEKGAKAKLSGSFGLNTPKNCTGNSTTCGNVTSPTIQSSVTTVALNGIQQDDQKLSATVSPAISKVTSSPMLTVASKNLEKETQSPPLITQHVTSKISSTVPSFVASQKKTVVTKAVSPKVEPVAAKVSVSAEERHLEDENQKKLMGDPVWKTVTEVTEQIAELKGVKLAYGLVGLLSFACIIPFMFSFLCCCDQVPGAASLRGNKSHPGEVSQHEAGGRTSTFWQWLAKLLFVLVSGTEFAFGILIAVFAYDIFGSPPAQLHGFFVTSAFWTGILLSRLIFSTSARIASSVRLMQFLLLVTAVVSSFAALIPHSSAITLGIEVFLIGCFLSPILPCVLGWLDMQKTIDWFALSLSYSASVSVGRTIVPYFAFLLVLRYSSFKCFFIYVSILLATAFLVLLVLTRSVRNVARVIAVQQLSKTLMESDKDEKKGTSKDTLKKTRKGGYMKLTDKDDDPELEIIASDEEYEDEL